MSAPAIPAIWFPAVRTGTGTDVFTERLVAGLIARGIRAEITWLPLRAEYALKRQPKARKLDWLRSNPDDADQAGASQPS